ncbi:hypothetical protein J6590_029989 [Homalodisca vitripennis]|nr:hypothetical protein J6590_029989 [Homalodisca vitripennis]
MRVVQLVIYMLINSVELRRAYLPTRTSLSIRWTGAHAQVTVYRVGANVSTCRAAANSNLNTRQYARTPHYVIMTSDTAASVNKDSWPTARYAYIPFSRTKDSEAYDQGNITAYVNTYQIGLEAIAISSRRDDLLYQNQIWNRYRHLLVQRSTVRSTSVLIIIRRRGAAGWWSVVATRL